MEIYERVRYLRKDCLKMSQEKFGAALGVNRDVIKNIELNLLVRPEQKEPLYKLICAEFNVSYEWLTTGNGGMYIESDDAIISALVDEFNLDEIGVSILTAYKGLDEKQREGVRAFIQNIAMDVMLNKPHLIDIESSPLAHVDKAIEKANEKVRLYIASESTTGKEHGVVTEPKEELDKLKKGNRVYTIDNF